jgi:hypothetical protein
VLLLGLFYIVFPAEPFDTAGGINEFLFARKERMTGGTDFNFNILGGGTGFYHITAGAAYLSDLIFGMDFLFHVSDPPVVRL